MRYVVLPATIHHLLSSTIIFSLSTDSFDSCFQCIEIFSVPAPLLTPRQHNCMLNYSKDEIF